MKRMGSLVAVLALSGCSVAGWADEQYRGADLENRNFRVHAYRGIPGVLVYSKAAGNNKLLELALVASGAAAAEPISKIPVVVKNDAGATVLRVTAGNAEADFALDPAGFVIITPGKNAGSVEVRAGARYAVLPDFFADDVVFDPARLAMPRLTVPAENFLLQFIEGGNTIVMCIWPGNLKLANTKDAAPAPKAEKEGPDPQVDLFFAGEGKARRVSAARIEFQGKPVYAGIIEHKGVWQDEDASALPAYKPTAIAWKRPFEARWRGDFVVAEGKSMSDWPARSQSFDFQSTTGARTDKPGERGTEALDAHFVAATSSARPAKWWEKGITWWEKGNENAPQIWQESLAGFFIYPAVLKGDEVRVCLYADKSERGKAEAATKAARKLNKDAPEVAPLNVYDCAIIYPLGRVATTPVNIYTPIDLMRVTLGQGPCEYVLDLAGIKPRSPGGDRPILSYATCGLWNQHIGPIVEKKLKKKPDGSFEPLDAENKARLIQALEEMWYFVRAVHDRLREYRKWGAGLAACCEQESARSAKVKLVADKIQAHLKRLNDDIGKHKFEGPGSEAYWKDRIPELINMAKEDRYAEVRTIGDIRTLGNNQDERVSRCRQYVKALRQEILLEDTSDADVRRFVAGTRDCCQQMLRNQHPKEGF